MLDALSGCKQLRHGLGGQCLCEVVRSLAYPLDNDLAMMTRPVLAKPFKAWSMIVMLIPVYDFIAILSFVCPKLTCIELPISLHNDRHLLGDGFVTVRPIAMKFGWDKESVSRSKFRKFHMNPSNFNRKWTMMFKLDLKKKYAYRI